MNIVAVVFGVLACISLLLFLALWIDGDCEINVLSTFISLTVIACISLFAWSNSATGESYFNYSTQSVGEHIRIVGVLSFKVI